MKLEGAALLEELIGVTQFPLQSEGDSVWAGLAVRAPDSSLEPLLPEGTWVLVASSEDAPERGAAVVVGIPTGEKLLGYFISSDAENGILLMRTHTPLLGPRLWWSPQGSRNIGVVIAFAGSSSD